MKKNYIKPSMVMATISTPTILAGSGNLNMNDSSVGEALSRDFNFGNANMEIQTDNE